MRRATTVLVSIAAALVMGAWTPHVHDAEQYVKTRHGDIAFSVRTPDKSWGYRDEGLAQRGHRQRDADGEHDAGGRQGRAEQPVPPVPLLPLVTAAPLRPPAPPRAAFQRRTRPARNPPCAAECLLA